MSPTRLYLPSSGAAAVSPAFDAEWETTSSAARFAAVTTRISSGMTNYFLPDGIAAVDRDRLCVQFVSAPIAPGPITGTFKGQLLALEEAASLNARAQIILRVVSNDGSTFRGTLYAGDLATLTGDPSSEFSTTATNRKFPRSGVTAVSTVAAQNNDRIVMELGWRKHGAISDVSGTGVVIGDDSGTDLPEDETTTASNNPWIEFSNDLFVSRGANVRAFILE